MNGRLNGARCREARHPARGEPIAFRAALEAAQDQQMTVRLVLMCVAFAAAASIPSLATPADAAAVGTEATVQQQHELAERYAPVVRLVAGRAGCGGLHYVPIDVDRLFGEPTVALPRRRAPARLCVPRLAAVSRRRADARNVRPRRDRPRAPGQARAP